MVALPKTPQMSGMTVTEFLTWPADPNGQVWQLIDGEPVAMAPASDIHGSIHAEIGFLVSAHLRQHRPSCRVVVAPGISPRVRANTNVRVPDLAVTCLPPSRDRHLMEQPVLAVEILSPSNEAKTWANTWAYTTIPSMQDILVVRSQEIGAELLSRQSDGSWPSEFQPVAGRVRVASIGAEFDIADFYSTTDMALGPGRL